MKVYYTTGEAADAIGVKQHCLLHAIRRSNAPEPKAGRLGGRRMFSKRDIDALREWFTKNRKYEPVGV